MIVFPNSKINLGLHILRKRTDSFHDLETVFYPIALQDALEIVHSDKEQTSITISGFTIDTSTEENICMKAYQLLKNDFPEIPAVKIHLHKTIPIGAGIGGGSSDAAFTLMLLNKKFHLLLNENQLINYAAQLGSDCAFFIRNRPVYATGRGEIIEDIKVDLSQFSIILINPRIHINTSHAFSSVIPNDKRYSLRDIILAPVATWKERLINDFEKSVFVREPEIKSIKDTLYNKGCLYAAMTGSGSSVFGIFQKSQQPQFEFPDHYFIRHL